MWPDLQTPIVFAHRGDNTHAPENTLSAFTKAVEKGADAIEFDVKLSADGHVIIIHDQTVDRTTNGHGQVRGMSLAALRDLDAGTQYPGQFPGEKIPTLEEVFESVGKRIYMNVELTNYATPFDRLVPEVVKLVKKFGLEKRVLFSSFFPHNLIKAARLLPEVPRGLLTWSGPMGWWGRNAGFRQERYAALHPYLDDVTPGLVNQVHAAGKRVHVWTVNGEDALKQMIGLGVDGIFTDDPGVALKLLGRNP
jgi:glycerophosphoryl diester phosphodiesterase